MTTHTHILGPETVLAFDCSTPEKYRKAHARGSRRLRIVLDPIAARVDAGRWLVDCPCGSGCSTRPDWGFACCFSCGAVHEAVTFPADVAAIEAALMQQPSPARRFWSPADGIIAQEG